MHSDSTIGAEELAVRMARRGGIAVSEAREIVALVGDAIREAVAGGRVVRFVGFGRMEAREGYAATRDPRTGERKGRGRRRVHFRGAEVTGGNR